MKAEIIIKSTPTGTAIAIASVLDRSCDDSPDDESEPTVGLAVDTDPVEIEEVDDDAIGVALAPALLVEDEEKCVAELKDDSPDDESELTVGLAVDRDPVEIEEVDDDAIGVALAPALLVEDEGKCVAEGEAELADDVVGAGGVAVNNAVAALGSTLLASPLIRSQKCGRPAD